MKQGIIAVMLAIILGCTIFPKPPAEPIVVAEVMPVIRQVGRCDQYIPAVRQAHFHYFGLDFPYWYGLGQLKQESACRAGAKSFDGGMGLAQFMPRTWTEVAGQIAVTDPYNPVHATKAQAFYMSRLHRSNWDGALWLTYCFYNSGPGTMKKEYRRVGVTDYTLMKSLCSRRVILLKNGGKLDLCDVGYDYPVKIHTFALSYKRGIDKINFW